jgi:hypothetical protein
VTHPARPLMTTMPPNTPASVSSDLIPVPEGSRNILDALSDFDRYCEFLPVRLDSGTYTVNILPDLPQTLANVEVGIGLDVMLTLQ